MMAELASSWQTFQLLVCPHAEPSAHEGPRFLEASPIQIPLSLRCRPRPFPQWASLSPATGPHLPAEAALGAGRRGSESQLTLVVPALVKCQIKMKAALPSLFDAPTELERKAAAAWSLGLCYFPKKPLPGEPAVLWILPGGRCPDTQKRWHFPSDPSGTQLSMLVSQVRTAG